MEDFSQSRGDDDLFDDEIIPFEEPAPPTENIATRLEQVSLDPEPVPPPSEAVPDPEPVPTPASAPKPSTSTIPTTSKESTSSGPRARPRGRGGNASSRGGIARKAGGLEDSKWAPKPAKAPAPEASSKDVPSESLPKQEQPPKETEQPSEQQPQPEDAASSPNVPNAPSGPASATTTQRPPAVRGDRTATGGVRKPKLTDEELTAKLAAAKERSQNIAAAHARAQADAASFEERERIASAKRERDRVERKAMDNEREKNRQRKMAVMGGREWDAGKNEEDFRITQNGRGGGERRAYAGGLTPAQQYQAEQDDLKMYEWHDDRGRGRGRGRGGRGGGRGRGGRGGSRGGGFGSDSAPYQQPDLSAEADFPALPGATKEASETATVTTPRPEPKRWDSDALMSPGDGGGSWAEQVESVEQAENKNKP